MDHGASTTTSDASAPELEDKPPCHLLTLPEDVLAQIVRCDDWFMALHWSMTCHKLHDVVTNMQPPMTVLDSIVLEPTFKTKPDSVLPLVDLFQFIWDESSDLLLKKMLLKKRRASYSIGQGLAKMFRAWTKTEAAQAWRQTHLTAHKVLESFTNGEDIGLEDIELDTVQIQDEYWECQLSVPNLHWDTDDRRLQKHLTAALQPLVDALTEFATLWSRMCHTYPYSSPTMMNNVFWPQYRDPPPWTCHSQLETMCTCGDAIAECAVKRRWGCYQPEQPAQATAGSDCEADFDSQPSSDFSANWEADWETMMKNLEEGIY